MMININKDIYSHNQNKMITIDKNLCLTSAVPKNDNKKNVLIRFVRSHAFLTLFDLKSVTTFSVFHIILKFVP
jgi:hypothetical protein